VFVRRGRDLESIVDDYHKRYPLRPGLPKSEAASRLEIDAGLVGALVATTPELQEDGPVILRSGFAIELGPEETAAWSAARDVLARDLAVPRASELHIPDELRHVLIRRGDLVRIDDDLVLLPEQVDAVTSGLATLPAVFTVAEFRDHFGLSRRHAVPLLEWLDGAGWTRRRGDGRSVSSPPGGPADAAQPR
jgi:selenocysteine-specific elongation factor